MTTSRPALNVHIRWMIRRDYAQILPIEAVSFSDDAWTEDDFRLCLAKKNCIGMVAEIGDTIYGYMVYELNKDNLKLLNFAVHQDHRRRGVGAAMIENKLKEKLSPYRRRRLVVDVAESNLPAQLFFRACAFRCTAVLRGGCSSRAGDEDAYRMVYCLPGHDDEPIQQNRIRQYEDQP